MVWMPGLRVGSPAGTMAAVVYIPLVVWAVRAIAVGGSGALFVSDWGGAPIQIWDLNLLRFS